MQQSLVGEQLQSCSAGACAGEEEELQFACGERFVFGEPFEDRLVALR